MKTVDPLHGVAAFLAVAEHQGFTAGAAALGLTRATVSAQVADLEARLGVRLLHRSTRNVRLTPAGQAYRDRLADLPGRLTEAERAARAEQTVPEGRLRVTAPPDLGLRFLVPWVTEFLRQHPGISIDMELSNAPRNLIESRFDLAIRGTLDVGPNLITRALGQSRLITCARADYLMRRGVPDRPGDLAGHDTLHFSGLRQGRTWTFLRGEERIDVPVNPRMEMSEGWALRSAALEGAGVVQLPAFIVGHDVREGRLVPVLSDWQGRPVPLHAVYPDNRLIAARVRAFVSFLAAKAKAEIDLQPT
ncbi:MAG: LysR substrate-binding domain-containing protein [Tabrizicola sp.]|uniref:LysR family transcriptional regulator n=1 Tax=Tabrizicola sp. TaxID=2005166 RepID=UPI0027324E9E|nr:LysR family transcriptional regulator [Tabrizicola sp.]MDP3263699.1 LysR substrate-binding domain-containing protein [Tabrizicola sp.]MDP3647063.1 LysR substrate-binding domain-containing protein [Paracoccaceae bacterium]MDZ4070111.1 LysR substrate-binding domain-containing protein [Tabrizicola sp.]